MVQVIFFHVGIHHIGKLWYPISYGNSGTKYRNIIAPQTKRKSFFVFKNLLLCSVVDPDSVNPDLDPEFEVNPGPDLDPGF